MKVDLSRNVAPHSAGSKVRRLVWECVHALFFRLTPRWMLNGWRCRVMRAFGAKIGRAVVLRNTVVCWKPDNLAIGDQSWIDGEVNLYSVDKITIGSNCVVSAGAFLCTASHDIRKEDFPLVTAPIVLEDGAWVAARAIVLPGVTLHEGCVVGAGAVVSKDVPAWTIVAGNPAREVGRRNIG